MAGEENFPATDKLEFPAIRFERLAFASEFGLQLALLSVDTRCHDDETNKEEKRMSSHVASFGLLGLVTL
jgi:hypothetical protein